LVADCAVTRFAGRLLRAIGALFPGEGQDIRGNGKRVGNALRVLCIVGGAGAKGVIDDDGAQAAGAKLSHE